VGVAELNLFVGCIGGEVGLLASSEGIGLFGGVEGIGLFVGGVEGVIELDLLGTADSTKIG